MFGKAVSEADSEDSSSAAKQEQRLVVNNLHQLKQLRSSVNIRTIELEIQFFNKNLRLRDVHDILEILLVSKFLVSLDLGR